ncbi:MAG: hypothetical protein ACI4A7_01460 [Prevotella sp.]
MAGKNYSEEAYQIRRQFDELVSSMQEQWKDEQARKFGYEHIEQIRRALYDIELPIESIVDFVDKKLDEIRYIANE